MPEYSMQHTSLSYPQAERFRGADLSRVAERARRSLGDDVMILHTRTVRDGGVPMVEVLAAPSTAIDLLRERLTPAPLPTSWRRRDGRPFTLALVGPTGAGKTTTAAKLAVKRGLFGAGRCGLLTIDSYRVGGMEQLATYAELADVAFEVVYDASEVDAAMKRLSATCDIVIVDTPGRSPARAELTERWRSLLDALAPDEVHLVLPATVRADLALQVARSYGPSRSAAGGAPHVGATHLLLGMATRWIADGQDVPADLNAGVPRLVRCFGLTADADEDWMPA
jgi:flagellar biosynthesis protein FlhF